MFFSRRLFSVLFVVSTSAHLLLGYAFWKAEIWSRIGIGDPLMEVRVSPETEISFEFVELPPEIPVADTAPDTPVVSDRNTVASDTEATPESDTNTPVTDGESSASNAVSTPAVSPEMASAPVPLPPESESAPPVPVVEPADVVEVIEETLLEPFEEEVVLKEEIRVARVMTPTVVEPEPVSLPEEPEALAGTPREPSMPQEAKKPEEDAGVERASIHVNLGTRETELAPYLSKLKREILQQWLPLMKNSFTGVARAHGEALLEFTVAPTGEAKNLKVLQTQDKVFADICLLAVSRAGPFDALPVEIPAYRRERGLGIHFTFEY